MTSRKEIGRVKITVRSGKPLLVREVFRGGEYKEELAVPQPKEKMMRYAIQQKPLNKTDEYPITREIERWLTQMEVEWL